MKKLVLAAGVLAVALVIPGTAPGALVNITVDDDFYDPQNATFDFPATPDARWDWDGIGPSNTVREHTVTQDKGLFKSGAPTNTGSFEVSASSGTYPYHCAVHGSAMTGTLNILVTSSEQDLDSLRLHWATPTTTTGNRFDVRYRIDSGPGEEPWKTWLKQTRKKSKVFGNDNRPTSFDLTRGDYEFSARSVKVKRNKRPKRSRFSPPLLVE